MEKETEYHQLDFFYLLPGFAGGRSLLEKRGPEHFRNLAYLSANRPESERRRAAQNAAVTRLRRLYTVPRTIEYEELEDRVVERVVPWFPHWATKRRRRPIYVRIELSRKKVRDMTPEEMMGRDE